MVSARLRTTAAVLSAVMVASLLSTTAAKANPNDSEADGVVETLESVPTDIPVLQDVVTKDATDLVAPGRTSSDAAAIEDVLDVSVSALGENLLSVELLAAQDAVAVSVS